MEHIVLAKKEALPLCLSALLPPRLCRELEDILPEQALVEELRLRRERCASATVSGKNLRLATVLSGEEIDALLLALCGGSLYAHGETLAAGYISFDRGIRVGVCGQAGVVGGQVSGVSEISSLAIRLPHKSPPIGGEIEALLRSFSLSRGVLLFSPPGVGKTTLLRAVTSRMAGGDDPLRVAVVDSRGELGFSLGSPSLLVDLLSGYPRGVGLSIATRSLAAQLIVSDEIGDLEEAREILAAHTCGVPLLATAHGEGLAELLARPGIRLLHEAGVFGAYVRLSRADGRFDFCYDITEWGAANALL